MGIEEEYPKGVCKECYLKEKQVRPLMQIDGRLQCPNCSSKHTKESGLINTIKDPGHEAFASGKIESIQPEYEELKEVTFPVKQLDKLIKGNSGSNDYSLLLDNLYNILHSQPVHSLPHAKHLLKLKKKILSLKNEIKLFMEEK